MLRFNCMESILFNCPEYSVMTLHIRVGPQDEKSSNLHITADSTGSIHKNAREKSLGVKLFFPGILIYRPS